MSKNITFKSHECHQSSNYDFVEHKNSIISVHFKTNNSPNEYFKIMIQSN